VVGLELHMMFMLCRDWYWVMGWVGDVKAVLLAIRDVLGLNPFR
jgi:hypothetical protein